MTLPEMLWTTIFAGKPSMQSNGAFTLQKTHNIGYIIHGWKNLSTNVRGLISHALRWVQHLFAYINLWWSHRTCVELYHKAFSFDISVPKQYGIYIPISHMKTLKVSHANSFPTYPFGTHGKGYSMPDQHSLLGSHQHTRWFNAIN